MNETELLDKAIRIATEAHHHQKDRSGQPYIMHPIRVMNRVNGIKEKIVAILHDVVEDTDWTFERLTKEGFPEEILAALDCVTKREGEPYEKFVERSASNPIACAVKIADLEDNMDLRRVAGEIDQKTLERLNKYLRAWRYLNR